MTMLSFRVDDTTREVQAWAQRLDVGRWELVREALRRHLLRPGSEVDAEIWQRTRCTGVSGHWRRVAHWGPAEIGRTGLMRRGEAWFPASVTGPRPPCPSDTALVDPSGGAAFVAQ